MGLFSTKKKIYVSSVLYNLAGDINDRPNFLKSSVGTQAVTKVYPDFGTAIQQNYLNGPGMNLRSWFRWATKPENYSLIGITDQQTTHEIDINPVILAAQIPHDPSLTVTVQKSEAGSADHIWWANQYMMAHYPTLQATNWTADIDDNNLITITFVDTTKVSFTPTNYDKNDIYIYAAYQTSTGKLTGALVTGSTTVMGPTDNFPSTLGWDTVSQVNIPKSADLTMTSATGAVTTNPNQTYMEYHYVYHQKQVSPSTGDVIQYLDLKMYFDQTYTIDSIVQSDGSSYQQLTVHRSYRIDSQLVTDQDFNPVQTFIYQVGLGNVALDNMVNSTTLTQPQYFPFIPMRINNKFATEYGNDDLSHLVRRAAQKLLGKASSFDDLGHKVAANPSLPDIDYTYISFGVVLNTKEETGREYLYRYFETLYESTSNTGNVSIWQGLLNTYNIAQTAFQTWRDAQSDVTNPLYGTTQPVVPPKPTLPQNSVRINSSGTAPGIDLDYDMRILWNVMEKVTGTGLFDPNQKGEYYISTGHSIANNTNIYSLAAFQTDLTSVGVTYAVHQIDALHWEAIKITGLDHQNYIYGGKFVDTSAADAMADTEESEFLVPLHYPTFLALGMKDYTQLSTACTYLVFNCYKVKKVHWYQRGLFKLLIVIVVIVVAVVLIPETGGASGIFGAGLLGSSAAVGAALGFSGLAAAIVGAVANAIAAALLLQIISKVSIAVFGDKIGAIIGAVAGVLALQVGTAISNGASFTSVLNSLGSAKNILSLTSAVGNGISGYVAGEVQDYADKSKALTQSYNQQQQTIQDAYTSLFGSDNTSLDLSSWTDSADSIYYAEQPDTFFSRTLMTGSDVAAMSFSVIDNFSDLSLNTNLVL